MRITKAVLDAKCENVNRLLGFNPDEITWKTEGSIVVEGAYDGCRVSIRTGQHGSTSPIGSHTYGPNRDAALILDGFREALLLIRSGDIKSPAVVEPRA